MRRVKDQPPEPPTMIRVLKYPIPIDDQWHEVPTPRTRDLEAGRWHVGMQDGVVMLWLAQTESNPHTDKVKVVGTGHEWNVENYYLGSVQDPRGFVWHVIAGGY